MRVGAVTRHTKSIYLGVGRVLCGASSALLSTTSLALNYQDQSLGVLTECSVNYSSEYQDLPVLGKIQHPVIKLKDDISLSVGIQEMTIRNIAISLGFPIDNVLYPDDVVPGQILLGTDSQPAELRIEAIFVYPDQQNYMALIFPKAIVRVNSNFSTSNSDASSAGVVFESRRADVKHGGVPEWNDSPLGKFVFSIFNL